MNASMTAAPVPVPAAVSLARPIAAPRRRLSWLIVIGIWTILPVLQALQAAFYSAYLGHPIEWNRLLPIRLADWYTCALFTPVCFWLVRRFPLQRGIWPRNLCVHLAVSSVAVTVKFALYVEVAKRIRPAETWRLDLLLARAFVPESIALWALLGIVHAIDYHARYRERELQAVRLESELAAARLDALTAQLQPHFLFNTLNSVSTLMHRDVDAADAMLTHLGDLLHRTLRQHDRHEIPLSEEIDLLRHYVDIMKIRFQDRLVVRMEIEDAVRDAAVPPLLLQPLVENAIRHGISRKPGIGTIEIAARAVDRALEITVHDDGEGHAGGEEGVGLSNTRRRLRELYGDRQTLELLASPDGGLLVKVRIPCAS
jgi:two-component system, LytTR family, sensor kinase